MLAFNWDSARLTLADEREARWFRLTSTLLFSYFTLHPSSNHTTAVGTMSEVIVYLYSLKRQLDRNRPGDNPYDPFLWLSTE